MFTQCFFALLITVLSQTIGQLGNESSGSQYWGEREEINQVNPDQKDQIIHEWSEGGNSNKIRTKEGKNGMSNDVEESKKRIKNKNNGGSRLLLVLNYYRNKRRHNKHHINYRHNRHRNRYANKRIQRHQHKRRHSRYRTNRHRYIKYRHKYRHNKRRSNYHRDRYRSNHHRNRYANKRIIQRHQHKRRHVSRHIKHRYKHLHKEHKKKKKKKEEKKHYPCFKISDGNRIDKCAKNRWCFSNEECASRDQICSFGKCINPKKCGQCAKYTGCMDTWDHANARSVKVCRCKNGYGGIKCDVRCESTKNKIMKSFRRRHTWTSLKRIWGACSSCIVSHPAVKTKRNDYTKWATCIACEKDNMIVPTTLTHKIWHHVAGLCQPNHDDRMSKDYHYGKYAITSSFTMHNSCLKISSGDRIDKCAETKWCFLDEECKKDQTCSFGKCINSKKCGPCAKPTKCRDTWDHMGMVVLSVT